MAKTLHAPLTATLLLASLVMSCSSDATHAAVFTDEVRHDDGSVEFDAGKRDSPSGDRAVPVALPRIGFATHRTGDLAVFDVDSGEELLRHPLSMVITDLCWDAHRNRLLVVEKNAYVDGSRVHALTYDGSFVHTRASPPLPGDARVFVADTRVFAIAEEYGAQWMELDEMLEPMVHREHRPRPASVLSVPGPSGSTLLALNARAANAQGAYDELMHFTDFAEEGWTVATSLLPEPPSTHSRLVGDPASGKHWLVRLSKASGFSVSRVHSDPLTSTLTQTQAHDSPWFGTLEGALFEPAQAALVVVVANPDSPADLLALLPTHGVEVAGPPAWVSIEGRVRQSPWFSRDFVADAPSGRLLLATERGILSWLPHGRRDAPALAPDPSFQAVGLRGPIALGFD